jgi:hypothetical protein
MLVRRPPSLRVNSPSGRRSFASLLVLAPLACGDAGAGTGLSAGLTAGDTSDLTSTGPAGSSGPTPTTGNGSVSETAAGSTSGGVKFDLPPGADVGQPNGPGSCRPSETYGAAGGFPAFQDPAYAPFLDRAVAIVTHYYFGSNPESYALTIVDISGAPPPPNMNYLAPLYHHPTWTTGNLGRIFGLTLDSDGNIYVAPSTAYGAVPPSPGTIKRIDRLTAEISDFATLPNMGPAMGNLNYDCVSQTIYVSSFEDGRIYQLDMNGQIVSTYHHGKGDVTLGPPADPGEPDGVVAPLGQLPWAVQSHAGRLYYSIWWDTIGEDSPDHNNEIWSVGYKDDSGVPDPATAKLEFSMPDDGVLKVPVTDISFAQTGWMLIAQRSMLKPIQHAAHLSAVFQLDYQNGAWVFLGQTYAVGEIKPYSASGGVDHDFDPNGYVWMTGDALDFYTPSVVYGLQGTPYGGGGVETSTIIDLDQEITMQDKAIYGDVELPIPGDASPVPPPG